MFRIVAVLVAVASVLLGLPAVNAAAGVRAPAGHMAQGVRAPAASSGPVVRVPPGDELVTGTGDADGYHLFAAAAGDRWAWHPLATLLPGGGGEQKWIGQQCLTGDGRTVVAVVAPWDAANSENGMDSGGYAYAIDARDGAVRPLARGVSLAYFNPSCGAADQVALTAFLGPDQRPTGVSVLRADSGKTVASTVIPGEITSAAWAGGRILAARGSELVDVTGNTVRVLARLPGEVAEIRAAGAGGADFVAEGAATSGLWHWNGRTAVLAGTGPTGSLHLFTGRGGHTVVVGATRLTASAGLIRGPGGAVEDVSLGGVTARVQTIARGARMPEPGLITVASPDGRGHRQVVLPRAAASAVTALPTETLTSLAGAAALTKAAPSAVNRVRAVSKGARPEGAGAANPAAGCAVPRNDIFKQAWQPTSGQVRWAINQAVQGALQPPYTSQQRPVDPAQYTVNDSSYTPLPTSYPSQEFPLVSGAPAPPPLVIYGILAQESNWQQASWHAVPGRAGNPLISTSGDCGYGIGQITDGMQLEPGQSLPTDTQVRLAVDYAANVAAAVQILQQKWVQLHELGITMNNDDPTKVENWYAAIWAYNSGVHLDPTGYQGLGWYNNPANMMYPVRHTYLHYQYIPTPDDASHPNDWPYQERVFGWMEVPLIGADGLLDYRGTYDWPSGPGGFLDTPGPDQFCGKAVNTCQPGLIGTGSDPCPAEDGTCYWDAPASWANCATSCVTDTVTDAPNGHTYYTTPGDPEPTASPVSTPCDTSALNPGAGAIVVDDETLDATKNPAGLSPNLQGCPLVPTGLIPPASAHASFEIQDSSLTDVLANPASLAAIDVHQLGGGLGGHLFFTHTGPPGQTSSESRGVWSATLPADPANGTVYEIKAFIPDIAAGSSHATYEISTSYDTFANKYRSAPFQGQEDNSLYDDQGRSILARTINQGAYADQWVSLGYYLCWPDSKLATGPNSCTMHVTLRSLTPAGDPTQGADIAFDAMAFVPVPTGGYVALGDSISSGEGAFYPSPSNSGVPDGYDDGTDVAANAPGELNDNGDLCHRSPMSWTSLLATAKGLPTVNLACSGSNLGDLAGISYSLDQTTTDYSVFGFHFYALNINNNGQVLNSPNGPTRDIPNNEHGGSAYFGEPTYQLELLRALHPKLVTVTVGGNDVGFVDILESCIARAPCKPSFQNPSGPDKISVRIASLQPLLASAYALIKAAAGTGNVYAVTYPTMIEADGSQNDCTFIQPGDRAWLASKVPVMAAAVRNAATQAGIKYIDISTLFNGHGPCSSNLPYVNPPDLPAPLCISTACVDTWFHPNKFGYQAIEAAVVGKISAS
jgi:lysophospholipase L1-like esterase